MDFEKLRQYRNQSNAFAQKLGITVEEIRPGYARSTKVTCADEINPSGITHGGVCFTMADLTAGAASSSHGRLSATVNADYHYLRPSHTGDTLTAEAREIKSGRTLCVYEVRITNQEGVLVGMGTYTFFIKETPLPIDG